MTSRRARATPPAAAIAGGARWSSAWHLRCGDGHRAKASRIIRWMVGRARSVSDRTSVGPRADRAGPARARRRATALVFDARLRRPVRAGRVRLRELRPRTAARRIPGRGDGVPSFRQPPGFPLVIAAISLVAGPDGRIGLGVSLVAGALVPVMTALLAVGGDRATGRRGSRGGCGAARGGGDRRAARPALAIERRRDVGHAVDRAGDDRRVGRLPVRADRSHALAPPRRRDGRGRHRHALGLRPRRRADRRRRRSSASGTVWASRPAAGDPGRRGARRSSGRSSWRRSPCRWVSPCVGGTTVPFAADFGAYPWDPLNALRTSFASSDGRLTYATTSGAFYLGQAVAPYWFGPPGLLAIWGAVWVARRGGLAASILLDRLAGDRAGLPGRVAVPEHAVLPQRDAARRDPRRARGLAARPDRRRLAAARPAGTPDRRSRPSPRRGLAPRRDRRGGPVHRELHRPPGRGPRRDPRASRRRSRRAPASSRWVRPASSSATGSRTSWSCSTSIRRRRPPSSPTAGRATSSSIPPRSTANGRGAARPLTVEAIRASRGLTRIDEAGAWTLYRIGSP